MEVACLVRGWLKLILIADTYPAGVSAGCERKIALQLCSRAVILQVNAGIKGMVRDVGECGQVRVPLRRNVA